MQIASLNPNRESANFIDFISSDFSEEIMRQNRLSFHIETDNFYYDSMNTGESVYNFITIKQDETKKIVNTTLPYGSSFENYLREFLSGLDANTDAYFDTLTKKKSNICSTDTMIFYFLEDLPRPM